MDISKNSVIILNGTSSSGKTSIAKEIVNQLEKPIIFAQIDMFHGMFDFSKFATGKEAFEASQIAYLLFDRALADMCKQEFPIIIDTVFERFEYYQNTLRATDGRSRFVVGVHCPLEELCLREKKRGDRRIGLASEQFDGIHSGKVYDMEVDTSRLPSSDCASRIIDRVSA